MILKRYGYFILFWLFNLSALAQTTYPLQVNVNLLPPYSLYLSDYYSTTREKIAVTLINRDQLKPSVNVRLRMIITTPGGVRIQTNDNAFFQPVLVENGSPVRLTQDELAPYFQPNNFITQGYLTGGKLPEGMVEFCFQAVEAYTGQVLSASTCTRAWITSQKPPLLSLPRNNESIAFREPLNVLFQWTPLHQGLALVEYDFILKELWDNGMTPQAAFNYSPEIYRETTRSTSIIYGAMQPPLLPGKRYAWCVRAKAREGLDEVNLFQNDGYSEIRWFTLQDNCLPPEFVEATAERKRINLTWNTLPEYIGFTVSYRVKSANGETQHEWKELQTQEAQAILYGLQSGATYEYRIASMCMAGQPVYTPIMQIAIPATDSARLAQCGILPDINLANQEPLKELKTAEEFKAGDFPITVVSVTGSNGNFSGQGWTIIPWLNDAKVAVEFKNIVINTDYQMTNGYVEAKYDKTEGQIANLDDVFEGGFDQGIVKTGLTKTDTTFNFSIPGVESFTLNEDGDLVITDAANETHTIAIADKEGQGNEGNNVLVFPMTVKDKDGNVYLVEKVSDPKDNTKEIAKATKLGTVGTPLPEGSFDPTQLNGDKAIVRFNKGNGKYAFDTWETYYDKISLIKGKYQKLYNNYYAPWKFLPSGESDEMAATIEIVDKNIDPTKVVFTTPLGTRYDATYANGTYTLRVTAGPEGDVQELYALYPRGEDKYYTLGKLGIATYQRQVYKVVLVSVEGAVIDAGIEQKLKDIYDQVGVTWQITREQFAYSGNIRLMENSTGLSTYNEAMRALNDAYKTSHAYDKSANYLFFLKATGNSDINNRDLAGFMPRGSQFGYIFTSEVKDANEAITVAHELGHGRWKLYHPFDKHYGGFDEARQTINLLAYGNGGHIAKWQWDQMNDPALVVSVFEGDERSFHAGTTERQQITRLIEMIRCSFINNENVSFNNPNPDHYFDFNDFELTPQIKLSNLKILYRRHDGNPLLDNHIEFDPSKVSSVLEGEAFFKTSYFEFKESKVGRVVFASSNKNDLVMLQKYLAPSIQTWREQTQARIKNIELNYKSPNFNFDEVKDVVYSYPCAFELVTDVDLKFEVLKRISEQWFILGQSEVVVINILNSTKTKEDAARMIQLMQSQKGLLKEFDDDFHSEEYDDYYAALSKLFLRSQSLEADQTIGNFTELLSQDEYENLLDNNLTAGEYLSKNGILLWSDPGYIKFFTQTGLTAINYSDVTINEDGNVSFEVDHVDWTGTDKDFKVNWPAFKPIVVLMLTSSGDVNMYSSEALFRGQAMIVPAIAINQLNSVENFNAFVRYLDAATFVLPVGYAIKGQRYVYLGIEIGLFSLQQILEDYNAELETSEAGRKVLRAWMVFNLIYAVHEMGGGAKGLKRSMDNLVTKLDDLNKTGSAKAKEFVVKVKTLLAKGDGVNSAGKVLEEAFESIASVQNLKKLSGVSVKQIDNISLNQLRSLKTTNGIDELANISTAEVNLNKSLNKRNFISHSGFDEFKSKIPNGSPSPNQNTKIFETFDAPTPAGNKLKRHNDAEVKIFEDIASQLGAKKGDVGTKVFIDVEGKIKLKTELCPCGSCSGVIEQFKIMFPKVEIEILAQPRQTF